ncbi:hypothetical protein Tco_0109469 [Tanacetum coccineum]
MKMEILFELTSNKLMVEHDEFDESDTHVLERFDTSAGNLDKEILFKLNLSDHRILKDGGKVKEFQRSFRHSDTERLSRSDEVLKLKNFKKDATLKLFNQQIKKGMSMSVQKSQDHMVARSHSRQAKEQCGHHLKTSSSWFFEISPDFFDSISLLVF